MSEPYRDPWLEYKAILESMKKKFLKKPNYASALSEFSALALRFQDVECEQYAAMCNLQMAKIYEGMGNWSLQYSRLLTAGRLFFEAERRRHNLCFKGHSEYLNHIQDCFTKAAKLVHSQNGIWLAGLHYTELANKLTKVGRHSIALKYFLRGAALLEVEHTSHVAALTSLAECQVRLSMYRDALATIDELWTAHMKSASDPKFGVGKEILEKCEVASVLLLTRIKSNDMSARHRLLLAMYEEPSTVLEDDKAGEETSHSGEDDQEELDLNDPEYEKKIEARMASLEEGFPPKDSALSRELFVNLYDFVNGLKHNRVEMAWRAFLEMQPMIDEMSTNIASDLYYTVQSKGKI